MQQDDRRKIGRMRISQASVEYILEQQDTNPMKRKILTLLLALGLIIGCLTPSFAQTAKTADTATTAEPVVAPKKPAMLAYPERTALWEKAIIGFEEKDKKNGMPAPGGILFVGSSSIVKWATLPEDFPGIPVINRGFGGSQIQDSTFYANRIITPYQPRTIVFYAGDNDIADKLTIEQVVGNFQTFVQKVRAVLPEVKILFLAIKPSPSRWHLESQMVAANKAIGDWMTTQKNMTLVDVHTPMLGEDGMPRPELYVSDRLHMNSEGYKIWTAILAPYLK